MLCNVLIFIIPFSLVPLVVHHGQQLETQTEQSSILQFNTNTTIFQQHFNEDNTIHCLRRLKLHSRGSVIRISIAYQAHPTQCITDKVMKIKGRQAADFSDTKQFLDALASLESDMTVSRATLFSRLQIVRYLDFD